MSMSWRTESEDESEDELEVSKQEVRFAHFSVKEFLISERASKSRFHISVQASHELIAERSILYMLSNLKAVDLPSSNTLPFLRYSARYWYKHVYAISNYEGFNDSIMQLFDYPASPCFVNWLRIWDPDYEYREYEISSGTMASTRRASLLCMLVGFSLYSETTSNKKVLTSTLKGDITAMLCKLRRTGGHEAVVRLLLEKGAEVNAQGGQYGNALQAASYRWP